MQAHRNGGNKMRSSLFIFLIFSQLTMMPLFVSCSRNKEIYHSLESRPLDSKRLDVVVDSRDDERNKKNIDHKNSQSFKCDNLEKEQCALGLKKLNVIKSTMEIPRDFSLVLAPYNLAVNIFKEIKIDYTISVESMADFIEDQINSSQLKMFVDWNEQVQMIKNTQSVEVYCDENIPLIDCLQSLSEVSSLLFGRPLVRGLLKKVEFSSKGQFINDPVKGQSLIVPVGPQVMSFVLELINKHPELATSLNLDKNDSIRLAQLQDYYRNHLNINLSCSLDEMRSCVKKAQELIDWKLNLGGVKVIEISDERSVLYCNKKLVIHLNTYKERVIDLLKESELDLVLSIEKRLYDDFGVRVACLTDYPLVEFKKTLVQFSHFKLSMDLEKQQGQSQDYVYYFGHHFNYLNIYGHFVFSYQQDFTTISSVVDQLKKDDEDRISYLAYKEKILKNYPFIQKLDCYLEKEMGVQTHDYSKITALTLSPSQCLSLISEFEKRLSNHQLPQDRFYRVVLGHNKKTEFNMNNELLIGSDLDNGMILTPDFFVEHERLMDELQKVKLQLSEKLEIDDCDCPQKTGMTPKFCFIGMNNLLKFVNGGDQIIKTYYKLMGLRKLEIVLQEMKSEKKWHQLPLDWFINDLEIVYHLPYLLDVISYHQELKKIKKKTEVDFVFLTNPESIIESLNLMKTLNQAEISWEAVPFRKILAINQMNDPRSSNTLSFDRPLMIVKNTLYVPSDITVEKLEEFLYGKFE